MKSASYLRFFVLAGLVAVVIPGFADSAPTTTPSLALSGRVTAVCSLSVQGTNAASALPILAGAKRLPIATATEFCNNQKGYSIWLYSLNGSKLLGNQGEVNPDSIPYTIGYGTTAAKYTLTTTGQKIATIPNRTGADGAPNDVTISFDGSDYLYADTYSDTLFFSIVAN